MKMLLRVLLIVGLVFGLAGLAGFDGTAYARPSHHHTKHQGVTPKAKHARAHHEPAAKPHKAAHHSKARHHKGR